MKRLFMAALLAGALSVPAKEFAPGKCSLFSTTVDRNAIVVGVGGLGWDDFSSTDGYGTKCFVDPGVVDAEKTAVDDDDDYWCGPITDMNILYITGWARKTPYATVDDMVDYFRANPRLLRYVTTSGDINIVVEGTYGYDKRKWYYDGIHRWFKKTTEVDLASFIKKDSGALTFKTFKSLMCAGEYVANVSVLFLPDSNTKNPKWKGMNVSHAVTCCGYEYDMSKQDSDKAALTGLFIIDSDNDQFVGEGGRAAPNSIAYCPVEWDGDMGMYKVEGIWGEPSWLLGGYTALKMYQGETKKVKLDANGGTVSPATIQAVEDGTYGELPDPKARSGYKFNGWWTSKTGGEQVQEGDCVDFTIYASPKTPTLYARWIKAYTITVKTAGARASYDEDVGGTVETDGTKAISVMPGTWCTLQAEDGITDKKGKDLVFQKWTVSPASATTALSPDFQVGECSTGFFMPEANLTFTATYVSLEKCGRLTVDGGEEDEDYCYYYFGYSEVFNDLGESICPPLEMLQWSPDGGKAWYNMGDSALLPAGTYTVTVRSNDPDWLASSDKTKATVVAGEDDNVISPDNFFTFIRTFAPGVRTIWIGEIDHCAPPPDGGTVSVSPKDGREAGGKPVTLTAKAAKGYAFVGWQVNGECFVSRSASVKSSEIPMEDAQISSEDGKVHLVAVFKAVGAYKAEDVAINRLEGEEFNSRTFAKEAYDEFGNVSSTSVTSATVIVYASCKIEEGISFEAAEACRPASYKLSGTLPKGLKFNAAKGSITGTPTSAAGETKTVTITASDPAKNTAAMSLTIIVKPLPTALVGNFRALLSHKIIEWVPNEATYTMYPVERADGTSIEGGVDLSVTASGKVSAKYASQTGTASLSCNLTFSGCDLSEVEEEEDRCGRFVFSGRIAIAGRNKAAFLSGGVDLERLEEGGAEYDIVCSAKPDPMYYGEEIEYDSGRATRQVTTAWCAENGLTDKYYTLPFCPDDEEDETGYGYLTVKTDKKGTAKVTGKLPDGQSISVSAPILPEYGDDGETGNGQVLIYGVPSDYKKNGHFGATITLSDGAATVSGEWTYPPEVTQSPFCEEPGVYRMTGQGAVYSAAKTLEDYYWTLSCGNPGGVSMSYSYKDESGETQDDSVEAYCLEDGIFNVELKGDAKGGITLARKSPAPWKQTEKWKDEDGVTYTDTWWNYEEDKNGNPITDPSQASFSFTKATGIFSGKATLYFDYWLPSYKKNSKTGEYEDKGSLQHKTVSLPYSGVVVRSGDVDLVGFGSAVYADKTAFFDDEETGKRKTFTHKVFLPVRME